jgi:hypothetical protein
MTNNHVNAGRNQLIKYDEQSSNTAQPYGMGITKLWERN